MLVTVVTPSLNGMKWLPACIDSVQQQTGPNVDVEHVFVDGGSTDGTPEFAASRGCVVMTREEPNVHFAINKGARNSRGELVGYLGCDDFLLPGALEAVVRQYLRDERRWVVGGCLWIDEDGRSLGPMRAPWNWMTVSMLATLGWNPFPIVFWNRELFEELDGYKSELTYVGDYDFYLRALQREPFSRVGRPLAGCGRHRDNVSRKRDTLHLEELANVADLAGPLPTWRLAAYRYGMKLWFNASSPAWFLRKRIGAVGARQVSVSAPASGT
jgi:glycosyltransferase involved in cell wall biosynthesis